MKRYGHEKLFRWLVFAALSSSGRPSPYPPEINAAWPLLAGMSLAHRREVSIVLREIKRAWPSCRILSGPLAFS